MNKTTIKIGELVYNELLNSKPKTEENANEIINDIKKYIDMQLSDYLIDEGIKSR